MECCGKMICSGCVHAPLYNNQGKVIVDKKCPFCRTPYPTIVAESITRLEKRMEVGDEHAFYMMGGFYKKGAYGLPQNSDKAIEFWGKAGKKGCANLGNDYDYGNGVERDTKMAKHYYELAAMEGHVGQAKFGSNRI